MTKYTKPDYSEQGASGVTLQGDLTFSYQHQTLAYKGSNTWKVVG